VEPREPHSGPNVSVGLALVALGSLVLLARLFGLSLLGFSWPFLIIIPGLLFFIAMALGGESSGPLAIPGSVVTALGLILLYQNTFHRFDTWAYVWALLPAAVGIGLIIEGAWSGKRGLVGAGLVVVTTSLLFLLTFAMAFEILPSFDRFVIRRLGIRTWRGIGSLLWPLAVIMPGLLLFALTFAGGRSLGPLAILASIVTTVGLLLFYQNTFRHFESWAYVWALIVVAAGFGLIVNGLWSRKPRLLRSGRRVAAIGMVLTCLGFVVFEMILNIGGFSNGLVGGIIWPVLLIGAGLLLLFRRGRSGRSTTCAHPVADPPGESGGDPG